MTPERYPYAVGDVVAGGNFSGAVEARPGPYSVVIDGVVTPISLIHRVVSRASAPVRTGGVFD